MKQGDIWLLNLDPTVGDEINKTRPCVLVSPDYLSPLKIRIIVPITEWKERYQGTPWKVHIAPSVQNGLYKPSAADVAQVRSLSTLRLVRLMGVLEKERMDEVLTSLQNLFS